ncbi:MAG: serine O-acetyltransferase [Candidatus Sumerlaeaceae bacterium]|nr:serine O-acetyltransferase [Candidatus Sumerlaeaceae bacterium]
MSSDKKKIWAELRREVEADAHEEPILASFLYAAVLNHATFEEALSFHLAAKLASPTLHAITLRDVMVAAHGRDHQIAEAAIADLKAIRERDPACRKYSTPFLYFKGFHALQSYRVAHSLWKEGRESLALQLQSRISEVFAVDIHPAARIGRGILMDHATSVVIGETAVVDDDVSILHEVTLGGTGKEQGDRHPKIRRGVLIAAGAKILGNIVIGEGAKVGGGSVVLHNVAPHTTVAGVPAKPVGKPHVAQPSKSMDQQIEDDPDFVPDYMI